MTSQYHTYGQQLGWHALFVVASKLLSQYPVTDDSYEDEPWDEFLNRWLLTRKDGLWLADSMDRSPIATKVNLLEKAENGLALTGSKAKIQGLVGVDSTLIKELVVQGQWRYSDTKIVEVDFKAPGLDGQPATQPIKTYDYAPHAGAADFDDSRWEALDPATLDKRRSTGRLCFNWYRIRLTIPERTGSFDPTGSTVVFETSLDDYAEIWVDGELTRGLGQSGGSVVSGWNAPNRLVIGRNVKPGQKIQLAVFGINGPLSNPPTNYIWMRFAKLDFYKGSVGPLSGIPREETCGLMEKLIIPLIHFVSDKTKMGNFTISITTKIAAWIIAAVLIVLNLFLIFHPHKMHLPGTLQ
jgi:hypothetical protein